MLHDIETLLSTIDKQDPSTQKEPVSVKNTKQGDCYWGTCKTVLVWIINEVIMAIHLPMHSHQRLAEILS